MRRITAMLALAFTLAGPVASALAEEGAQAVACAPSGSANRRDIFFTAGGGWNLHPTLGAMLVCSTVRTGLGSPTRLYVDYFDGSTTEAVGCMASAIGFDGNSSSWTQGLSSDGVGTGPNNLLFQIPSSLLGYIVLVCTIPPDVVSASGIVGFNLQ